MSNKTLTISDLERLIGKRVEVIVLEDDQADPVVATPKRPFGTMAGKIEVADDFDAPLATLLTC